VTRGEARSRLPATIAGRAEHLVGGYAKVLDLEHVRQSPNDRSYQHAHRADSGIWQIDKEHARAVVRLRHDNADSGALGSGDEILSPVDDLVIAIQSARGLHHRRIGPEVATPHSTTIERTSAN